MRRNKQHTTKARELFGEDAVAYSERSGKFDDRTKGCTMKTKLTKAQQQQLAVVDAVLAAGFVAAGTTSTEAVRIPTQRSPVYGATGGELRTLGGRARYTKPGSDVRVTVGPRTTNIYRVVNGDTRFLANLNTRDVLPAALTQSLLAWSVTQQGVA